MGVQQWRTLPSCYQSVSQRADEANDHARVRSERLRLFVLWSSFAWVDVDPSTARLCNSVINRNKLHRKGVDSTAAQRQDFGGAHWWIGE